MSRVQSALLFVEFKESDELKDLASTILFGAKMMSESAITGNVGNTMP